MPLPDHGRRMGEVNASIDRSRQGLTASAVHADTMNNAPGGCQNPNCYKLFQVIGGIGAFGARKGFRSLHGMMTSVVPNA